ncbi:MAG: hypothetical protein KDB68_14690 [Planctomycetes bacterium]|nr:hypothetical protein [Planctomycetota bacterium]
MKFRPVSGVPRLESTPLAEISIRDTSVVVELDDENDKRIRLVFDPRQAIRVTTSDCFILPSDLTIIPQVVVEVLESEWIAELRSNLRKIDAGADFMDRAHHYLIPLQDDFLEVVAWGVRIEDIATSV